MAARVGIVIFVVDLDFRLTAAVRWCDVGQAVGAASSLPGNACKVMQGVNLGPRSRGGSLRDGLRLKYCSLDTNPQLKRKFQNSNGHDPVGVWSG